MQPPWIIRLTWQTYGLIVAVRKTNRQSLRRIRRKFVVAGQRETYPTVKVKVAVANDPQVAWPALQKHFESTCRSFAMRIRMNRVRRRERDRCGGELSASWSRTPP